ncbi:retrotransposon-related protein [Tanacetum coccineum]
MQHVPVVDGLNLDSDVAEWFCWMHHNKLIATWDNFLENTRIHFGSSKLEDPQGTLSKLIQTRRVAKYHAEFKKLMNGVMRINEPLLISFYTSGLKHSLQSKLLVAKPQTLGEAFTVASIAEACFEDSWMNTRVNIHGRMP